jgi:hypothetical protein
MDSWLESLVTIGLCPVVFASLILLAGLDLAMTRTRLTFRLAIFLGIPAIISVLLFGLIMVLRILETIY